VRTGNETCTGAFRLLTTCWYLFADLCDGQVRAMRQGPDDVVQKTSVSSWMGSPREDDEGEIYLLSLYWGVHRLEAR
jgi:hypothetical protein